jgi:sulfate transport system ATP-binding protein
VALARALAIEPQLLLLDEPFGALDALVRKEVRRWVRGLHERLGLTSILVTHDQEEAMEMADRVAVMERGRIVQFAAPTALLANPATPFVAGFLGDAVRLSGMVTGGVLDIPGLGELVQQRLPDGIAEVFLRPHDLYVAAGAGMGVVRHARPEASGGFRILVECGGRLIEGIGPAGLAPGAAARVEVRGGTAFGADGVGRALLASAGPC